MTCLSTNEVVGFLHGHLDADAQEAVERHLDDCPACRYLVVELARADSPSPQEAAEAREQEALATTAPQGFPALHESGATVTTVEPTGYAEAAGRKVVTEIEGRYQVRSELRRGGQARILVAYDTFLGREVALKELTPDPESDDGEGDGASEGLSALGRRFMREARITSRLTHPSIVHVYEMGCRADGTLYYTMPLVRGHTLAEEVGRNPGAAARLRLLDHFENLCQGIAYAHSRGVLHRDIKPENVMIGEFGETVLLDWGLAKSTRRDPDAEARGRESDASEALTAAGMTVGTPAYMSPEQAAGQLHEVDERSDVWGLGTVLYVILTGRAPFRGKTAGELVEQVLTARYAPIRRSAPDAPAALAAIAEKCLPRDRRHRYQSVKELQADLRAYHSGGRVQAYRYTPWERLRGYGSRHRRLLLLLAAAIAGVAATLVVMGREYGHEVRTRRALVASLESLRADARRVGQARRRAAQELSRAYLARAASYHARHHLGLCRLYAAAALASTPARRSLGPPSPARRLRARALRRLAACSHGRVAGLRHRWPVHSRPHPLAAAPDGRSFAYVGPRGAVWLQDVRTRRARRIRPSSPGAPPRLAFSPTGHTLAVAQGRTVSLLDPHTGALRGQVSLRNGSATAIALAAHPEPAPRAARAAKAARVDRLAVADGRQIQLWELRSPPVLRATLNAAAVSRLAFSPDSARLAVGTRTGALLQWNLRARRELHDTGVRLRHVLALTARPIGPGWVAAGSAGPLWFTGIGMTDAHRGPVRDLAFTPDGTLLASAGDDATVRLWDPTGRPLEVLDLPAGVYAVRFLDRGALLVTASRDGHARTWQLAAPRPGNPLRPHGAGGVDAHLRTLPPAQLLRRMEQQTGWTLEAHLKHTEGGRPE